jgi:hypothetical protein
MIAVDFLPADRYNIVMISLALVDLSSVVIVIDRGAGDI